MNLTLDTPRFLFADLAIATGVDQNNLKGWLNRGAARFGPYDRPAGGSGKRALVTLRTVYEFAITARLVGIGIPPALAFMCATAFSGRRGEDDVDPTDSSKNLPFVNLGIDQTDIRNADTLLFDRGNTVFIIWHNDRMVEFDPLGAANSIAFDIINIDDASDKRTLLDVLFSDNFCAANVLYCNPILDAVDKVLGVRRG